MIYSKTGLTQKVRTDLNGGLDIRGRTVRNLYLEMSKGTTTHRRGVAVADAPALRGVVLRRQCEAGRASDVGHPDNPRGTGQMAIDAVRRCTTPTPTSRSPTTTSRTRATRTTTATSTSRTASSTTWS